MDTASQNDLAGKVAIVTGGGKGIGKAIASELAQAGARVDMAGGTEAEIEAVAEEVRAASGKELAVISDLTVSEQIGNLIEITTKEFGTIDILVNDAALCYAPPLLDFREESWDRIFDTNCVGAFLLSRAAANEMIDQWGGEIINITTVRAEGGVRAWASKMPARVL